MTKTIIFKNLKIGLNIFGGDENIQQLKNKKEIEKELKYQLIQTEREAQLRNYYWIS